MLKRSMALFLLIIMSFSFISCVTPEMPHLAGEISNISEQFIVLLARGDYKLATTYLDSNLQQELTASDLGQAWDELLNQVGPYIGQVNRHQEEIEGYDAVNVNTEFKDAFIDILMLFDSSKRIAGLWFNVAYSAGNTVYVSPFYVDEDDLEEVEVTVGKGEWELPGTLTMPAEGGPFPAVVLVHGLGPQDRDQSLGPNKLFKDLALGLASHGIAVLRYEKRTLEHSEKVQMFLDSVTVWDETINDALAAVSLLKATDNIDSSQIYILGHSLGGTLAPRIAAEDVDIAGIIIMAGAVRPLEDLIMAHKNYLANLDGTISLRDKEELKQLEKQVERVKDPELSGETPAEDLPLGLPAAYWLDLRDYNPVDTAGKLSIPILILQGEDDFQITMEDFHMWGDALEERENVILLSYEGLNHLFIKGEWESKPKDYQYFGNVFMPVIMDIALWLKK